MKKLSIYFLALGTFIFSIFLTHDMIRLHQYKQFISTVEAGQDAYEVFRIGLKKGSIAINISSQSVTAYGRNDVVSGTLNIFSKSILFHDGKQYHFEENNKIVKNEVDEMVRP